MRCDWRTEKRKHQERKRVNEMIKHGLVPDIEHPVCFKHLLEAMCPKGTERDGQKTKQSCDPKECESTS